MAKSATLSYDADENIVFVGFDEPVELNTRDEIAAHFERVIDFWRANAGGRKSYFVADFTNVTTSMQEIGFYAEQTKRAHEECAIASVRYGGNPLQRTLTRLAGMRIHQPSNLYQTREEAMAVVRALRSGELAQGAASAKK